MRHKPQTQSGITPAALGALISGNIGNFIAASTPGGIEAQEKAGQLEQAAKETLPREMRKQRPMLEHLGFKFGDNIDGLFVECTFPAGWTKRPTDNSMWTDIVDAKGRKRGSIFYKAAFYDKSANASLCCRFGVRTVYGDKHAESVVVSDACGEPPFTVPLLKPATDSREDSIAAYNAQDAAREKCIQWLKANFPDSDSPTAYWPD